MVARVATFDDAPILQADDERRVASLRELARSLPGFVAGYHLREENAGRLLSVSIWESDEAMIRGEEGHQEPAVVRSARHPAVASRALDRRRRVLTARRAALAAGSIP